MRKFWVWLTPVLILGIGTRGNENPSNKRTFTPIDNLNQYAQMKTGQYKYPVIFEPIRNIRLSISSYQVTTFIDLKPYFDYFESYGQYLDDFLRDLADKSKMSFLAKYHHRTVKLGKNYPEDELDAVNCDTLATCDDHPSPNLCHRLFNFCMSQRQYFQVTNSTVHIKETFVALRDKFLGIIDYLDETLRSIAPPSNGKQKRQVNTFRTQMEDSERQSIVRTMEILDKYINKMENPGGVYNTLQEYPLQYLKVGKESVQVSGILDDEEPLLVRTERTKRNPLVWAGLGWGIYSNKRQIDQIKHNIKRLQDQNVLQDRKIDELPRYMNLTMEKVREHDKCLYDLEVGLVQLKNSLIDLSYDLDYSVVITHLLRNAQTAVHRLMIGLTAAQHNVDRVLEYLRAMAMHQCSPVIISSPVLQDLLQKVEGRLTSNPRLRLPYNSKIDISRFYNIVRITPVVLDKLLVVLLTIQLTDQSLEMNIFKIHNLPLVHPEYHVSAKYKIEGDYITVDKKGMYVALPEETSLQICLMSDLGLWTMRNVLYLSELVEWCVYALYIEDEEKIDKYCRYTFEYTDRNYAKSLGGFMWVVSAIIAEKLQV